MNIIKLLFIILVFFLFFFLLKHYNNLESFKFDYHDEKIPIIESDNKPFKILPPPGEIIDPLEQSCTLNNEC